MRFVRLPRGRGGTGRAPRWRVIGALFTAAALSGGAGCAEAVASSDAISVTVSPETVNAGSQTTVTANCGASVSSATVSSTVFGSLTLQSAGGVLSATAIIPANAPSGKFGVRLACPTGNQATTTITIKGASPGASQPGPNTGGGFLAGNVDDERADPPGSEPADRTPLVWVGAGVGFLLAAAAAAVRAKQRAAVRTVPRPSRDDQGTAGPR